MASTSAAVKTSFSVCKALFRPVGRSFALQGVLYSPVPVKPSDGLVGLPAVPLALPHGRSAFFSSAISLLPSLVASVHYLKVPISEAVKVAFQVRVKGLEVVLCDDLFS